MTADSKVITQKVVVTQLLKKVPFFYRAQRFITIYKYSFIIFNNFNMLWSSSDVNPQHPLSPVYQNYRRDTFYLLLKLSDK
jgi:hypothetical protein